MSDNDMECFANTGVNTYDDVSKLCFHETPKGTLLERDEAFRLGRLPNSIGSGHDQFGCRFAVATLRFDLIASGYCKER
jgi:hypothetical protein